MRKDEVMAVEKSARKAQVLKRPESSETEHGLRAAGASDGIFAAADLVKTKAAAAFLSGQDVVAQALRQAAFDIERMAKS